MTFELDNENEIFQIISDYEKNGWEMLSRSATTPVNDKFNVTIEFKLR
jgi:hypothetical protein